MLQCFEVRINIRQGNQVVFITRGASEDSITLITKAANASLSKFADSVTAFMSAALTSICMRLFEGAETVWSAYQNSSGPGT